MTTLSDVVITCNPEPADKVFVYFPAPAKDIEAAFHPNGENVSESPQMLHVHTNEAAFIKN